MSIGQLVRQYQGLVSSDPERFGTEVAQALDELCARLGDEVEGTEQLVIDYPAAIQAELPLSLTKLADRLAEQGRHADELEARRLVLSLREQGGQLPLAQALSRLATTLTALGDLDEAMSSRRRAYRILRTLAKSDEQHWPAVVEEAEPYGELLLRLGKKAKAALVAGQAVRGLAPLVVADGEWAREPYAQALLLHARMLGEKGEPQEGIVAAEQAVEQFRLLGGGYDLAFTLNVLGKLQHDAGDPAAALSAAKEALRVAQETPDDQMTIEFAWENLAVRHANLGDWAAARDSLLQAKDVLAALVDKDPSLASQYASLLGRLSDVHVQLQEFQEALEAMLEVSEQYRELARTDASPHLADYALSLVNLGIRYASVGRKPKAVYATQESIKHYRRLMKQDSAWTADLGQAHSFLSDRLAESGQKDRAVEEMRNAVKLFRKSQDADLGEALKALGSRLHDVGDLEESLKATSEAVELFRANEDTPNVAHGLYNAAVTAKVAERYEEALRHARESAELYQRLYDDDTGWALPLANVLGFLGVIRELAGQFEHAVTSMERAVSLLERLYEPGDEERGEELARALHNLSRYHEEEDRLDRALARMRRSMSLYGELTANNPERFRGRLASAWVSLGVYHHHLDENEEAISAYQMAAELYREAGLREGLAHALFLLSNRQGDLGNTDKSIQIMSGALEIYEELSLIEPDPYLGKMAMALDNLATRHYERSQHIQALPLLERAADIWLQLDDSASLAGTLHCQLFVLSCLDGSTEETIERLIDVQQDLGATVRTLNDVAQQLLGDNHLDQAQRHLDRASGLWEVHLLAQPDADPALYVHILDSQASAWARQGYPEQAVVAQLKVVELFEPWVASDPDGYLGALSVVLDRLADYLRDAGQPAEALPHRRRVVEIKERLAAFDPRYRAALVQALTDLGRLLEELSLDEAAKVLARASTLRAALPAEDQ